MSRHAYSRWLAAFAVLLTAGGCSHVHPEPELQVVNILNAQADAWNRGDLDAFMDHFSRSDDLTASSEGGTIRGWAAARGEYDRRHAATSGRLRYDDVHIQPLAEEVILAVGRWSIEGDLETRHGTFSCLFRRVADRWFIVHDHCSTAGASDWGEHKEVEQHEGVGSLQ